VQIVYQHTDIHAMLVPTHDLLGLLKSPKTTQRNPKFPPKSPTMSTRPDSAPTPPNIGEGKRGKAGHIAYLLRQAQGSVRHAHDRNLAAIDLTAPQFIVLTLVNAYPSTSGAELARIAQLTPQTMNLIVRKLERDGYIKRSEPGAHGRVLQQILTTSGKSKLRQARLIADAVETKIVAGLSAGDEAIIRNWLTNVAIGLDKNET
jgi:DNA-binding MarR family transcriptional regulator